jgi:hypothetical protein
MNLADASNGSPDALHSDAADLVISQEILYRAYP